MSAKKKYSFNENVPKIILYSTLFIFAALTIVGAAAVILTAYYGVPMGDDYLAIDTFSNRHTWLTEAWYSFTHTGRYLQSITSSIAYGGLRGHIAVILPLFVLIWVYTLVYLACRLAADRTKIQLTKVHAHFIALALLVIIVTTGKVLDKSGVWLMYQPFYFSSAIVTYTLGVLLYATIAYLYIRFNSIVKKHSKTSLIVFFALTYLIGLYNETTSATLFGLSVLGVVGTYLYHRRSAGSKLLRKYLYALASSSTLALITMYFSPSSAARREATGAMQDSSLITPVTERVWTTITQIMYQPVDLFLITVLAVLIYWFILKSQNLLPRIYLRISVIGGFIVGASLLSLIAALTLLVLGYGPHTAIYPRTMLLVQVLCVIGAFVVAVGVIGLILEKLPKKIESFGLLAVAIVSLVGVVIVTPHLMERFTNDLEGVVNYKAAWVEQDRILREAARTRPEETIYLDDAGAGIGDGFSIQCNSPFSSSTSWLNDGLEEFYDVEKICSKSDL